MGDVAALVEGVEDATVDGRGATGDKAVGAEGVGGLEVARAVEFGHGVGAVVEVVGPRPGVGLLPRLLWPLAASHLASLCSSAFSSSAQN